MTRFNFLTPTGIALLDELRDAKVSPGLRNAAFTLALSLLFLAVSLVVEHARLAHARAELAHNRSLAESDRLQLEAARNEVSRVQGLISTARELDHVKLSGPRFAIEIARLGDCLPTDVWVDSVAEDGHTARMQGQAASYTSLSHAIASLAALDDSGTIALRQSQRVERYGLASIVAYELALEEKEP